MLGMCGEASSSGKESVGTRQDFAEKFTGIYVNTITPTPNRTRTSKQNTNPYEFSWLCAHNPPFPLPPSLRNGKEMGGERDGGGVVVWGWVNPLSPFQDEKS